jgi:hypothetical protein
VNIDLVDDPAIVERNAAFDFIDRAYKKSIINGGSGVYRSGTNEMLRSSICWGRLWILCRVEGRTRQKSSASSLADHRLDLFAFISTIRTPLSKEICAGCPRLAIPSTLAMRQPFKKQRIRIFAFKAKGLPKRQPLKK